MNEMMKWIKKFSQNQKGFSLVELLCAVAILSIVIASVGTSMVVSARSYQRGNAELDLQQKAQITANLLTNLIIDSDEVISPPAGGAHSSELKLKKIEGGVSVEYQISLSGTSLSYTAGSDSGILAEDISSFSIWRVSDNNFDFNLEVTGNGGRTFASDYHVTRRNGVSAGGSATTGISKSIWAESDLTLEPNQVYEDLNVQIIGASTAGYTIENLSGNTDPNTKVEPKDANTIKITVGRDECGDAGAGGAFSFQIKSNDAEVAPFNVNVHVRRVTGISVGGSKTEGSRAKANSVYQVAAQTTGPNLPRVSGAWYDLDYVPTHPVTWELQGEGLPNPVGNYARIESSSEDASVPFCKVRLLQDIPQGGAVKVVAVAKHPEGMVGADRTNKTGLPYGTVQGEYVIKNATDINRGESADYRPFSFGIGDLGQLYDKVKALYESKIASDPAGTVTTNIKYNEIKAWYDSLAPEYKNGAYVGNAIQNKFPNHQSYVEYRFVLDEEKADESKWSPWIPVMECRGGTPIFRPEETSYFRPDKDYILQTRVAMVDSSDPSIVYWPLEDTPQDQYMKEYFVSKVTISDIYFEWWDGVENCISRETNIPKGTMFSVKIGEAIGYGEQSIAGHIWAIVERETSPGVWEDVTSGFEGLNHAMSKGGSVAEYTNARSNTPGNYRLMFCLRGIDYRENVGAGSVPVDCNLFDRSTGEGVFYFSITE